MSSLIVEVCRVDKIEAHPQADRMAIATVKGWKTCIRKNEDGTTQFKEGDLCVFIPPDAVLTKELADKLGVANYLKQLAKSADGSRPTGGRVAVARLRGQPSYGLISDLGILPDKRGPSQIGLVEWKPGDDVAAILGITKWEPPVSCTDGDAERPHPAFHKYFDLENWRNFPDLIPVGTLVRLTEKIHGKNWRAARIRDADANGNAVWTWMAGSHDVRRKEFVTRTKKTFDKVTGELNKEEYQDKSQFWLALDRPGVRDMLLAISGDQHNVVVFGEIFGSGVQDMAYGFENGHWDIRVFDITVNGKYLGTAEKTAWCEKFGVKMVPTLYEGPFSPEIVEQHVNGTTTVCATEQAGSFKGREGVVITSCEEKSVTTEKKIFERMALKAISFDYLERKGGTEFH